MGMAFDLEPAEKFAERYVVERLLGEGNRKRTYLARDMKVDRLVALSLVKPESARSDPEGTAREARILGRIGSHDNIVSLYDYDISPDGSAQYIVFEFLSGGTLAEHLRQTGPLPLAGLLRLGRQLCRGLAHLHGRGLLHRDVSPENIWLDERHVAHLGDFDSAITVAGTGTVAGTDELRPITTGSFAAPEELEGRSKFQKMPPAEALKEIRKALSKAVTKTIAAFLNTAGGTLLIGVDDAGSILGVEADFPYLHQDKQHADGWLLSSTQIITNALGPGAASAVHTSLVRHGDVTVAVVHCPARSSVTWHTEDHDERFYFRASNATRELNGSSLVKYIHERWNS